LNLDEFCRLLRTLIEGPPVQSLWLVHDRGVPVFAHSMDVALLCLEAYPDWRERYPGFRLDVVLFGCVLHDLSKASARNGHGVSHSHIMTHEPGLAVAEAVTALGTAQDQAEVWLDEETIDHVWHVVAAHHGRWGKVRPQTPEAYLVASSDNVSATQHRIAPVDANDILPLMEQGYRWAQIGERLGVNRGVVKARLQDACQAERVRSPSALLDLWRSRGSVVAADAERLRQIARSRFVLDFARRCPVALLDEARPLLMSTDEQATP
jgi:hypothetical protein